MLTLSIYIINYNISYLIIKNNINLSINLV